MRKALTLGLLALIVMFSSTLLCGQGAGTDRRDHEDQIAGFLDELSEFGRENRRLNVPPEHGRYLRLMVEAVAAQRAVEVGTSNGYSACWIALGLERTGGELTTIEIDEARVKEARANLEEAELDDVVTCELGDALKVIPTVEGPTDFLFIDALKEDYLKYLKLAMPELADDAVILAHNAVAQARAMSDYLEFVRTDPRFTTVIVQIEPGDGFAVSYYHAGQ